MNGSVTGRRVERLRVTLTERDWQIMSTLAQIRAATSAQLIALHLSDINLRRAQRKLTGLVHKRVLARLPRTVGGPRAGSTGHVYALDVAGQRLIDLVADGRVRRPWPLGAPFLAHTLAVTDLYVRLVEAERAGSLRVLRFTTEPKSWRSFHGVGGGRVTLKPDALTVLVVDGYEDHWFLEVDLATEAAPTITHKCAVYRAYWQSGTEQARLGLFPRVLWLAPDERRADVLCRVVRRQPEEAAELFAVALFDNAVARLRRGAGS